MLGWTYSRAKREVLVGHATVDGEVVTDPGRILRPGAVVAHRPSLPRRSAVPRGPGIEILHVDEDLVIVNKPSGVLVHPTSDGEEDTVLARLVVELARRFGNPRKVYVVHRLDRDTSGVMVLARNHAATQHLQLQFRAHSVSRRYRALVAGDVAEEVLVDRGIGRPRPGARRAAFATGGLPARTTVRPLERFGSTTLVEAELGTGRTHQVRVHLSALGHPVLGDPIYGGPTTPWRSRAWRSMPLTSGSSTRAPGHASSSTRRCRLTSPAPSPQHAGGPWQRAADSYRRRGRCVQVDGKAKQPGSRLPCVGHADAGKRQHRLRRTADTVVGQPQRAGRREVGAVERRGRSPAPDTAGRDRRAGPCRLSPARRASIDAMPAERHGAAQQHRLRHPCRARHDVGAVVHPVGEVDVEMPGLTPHHLDACGPPPAEGVARGIARLPRYASTSTSRTIATPEPASRTSSLPSRSRATVQVSRW